MNGLTLLGGLVVTITNNKELDLVSNINIELETYANDCAKLEYQPNLNLDSQKTGLDGLLRALYYTGITKDLLIVNNSTEIPTKGLISKWVDTNCFDSIYD